MSRRSRREARYARQTKQERQRARQLAALDRKIREAKQIKPGEKALEDLYCEVQRLGSASRFAKSVCRTVRAIREARRRVQHLAELREQGLIPRVGSLK